MTTPETNNERSERIVDEMITRLRELQGSGEYPPLNRKVEAGAGLQGGGTLEADMVLALGEDEQALLQALEARGDLAGLATTEEVAEALQGYVLAEDVAAQVTYRDFTVTDPPLADVVSPPLRMDVASVVERVTVTVGAPSDEAVRVVLVAGARRVEVEVPAATESVSATPGLAVGEGGLLQVEVAATTAARVVVSLRVRESGA